MSIFDSLFKSAREPETEHALVLVGKASGPMLIHGVGIAIESDLEEAGLGPDEAGPTLQAPKMPGLWVWEGTPGWDSGWNREYNVDEGATPYYEGRGKWRRATSDEVAKLAAGKMNELFGPSRWPPKGEEAVDEGVAPASSSEDPQAVPEVRGKDDPT